MRYHFLLHYGWFLQNLEKDFIPTLMNTTVYYVMVYIYRKPTLAAKKISDTMMQGHGSQCKNLFLNLWHKINKAPKHNQTAQNQFDT